AKGAIGPWGKRLAEKYARSIARLCELYKVGASTPFGDMPEKLQQAILNGPEEHDVERLKAGTGRVFKGIVPILLRRYKESESDWVRSDLEKYMTEKVCEVCGGRRLRLEAYHVLLGGRAIHEVTAAAVERSAEFLRTLKLARREQEVAKLVLREIV